VRYRFSLSAEAVYFLNDRSPRERANLLKIFEKIAAAPDAMADVEGMRVAGRECMLRVEQDWTLIYWLDHPLREVRFMVVERSV